MSKITGTIRAKIWRDIPDTGQYLIKLSDFNVIEHGKTEALAIAAAEYHLFAMYALDKKFGQVPFAGIVRRKSLDEANSEVSDPPERYEIGLPQVIWDAMKAVQP